MIPLLLAAAVAASPLKVEAAWIAPPPPGAPAAAGYLVVRNTGRTADRLVGVASPAAKVEIHTMSMTGGVMRMRPVAGGLEAPAGQALRIVPSGGTHLMWTGAKAPLTPGAHVPATLRFASGASEAVVFEVRATPPAAAALAPR